MNCKLCQKELNAYLEGQLPEGIRAQVEAHLAGCKVCSTAYSAMLIAEKVFESEKSQVSNPFLSTRIMAGIEEIEQERLNNQHISIFNKVLKPVIIGISLSAAMYVGILAGNINKPLQAESTLPVELAYFDDEAIESVYMISNE